MIEHEARFFAWLRRAVEIRVGNDGNNWLFVYQMDSLNFEHEVRLIRPSDNSHPRMVATGRAPDVLRIGGWRGWNIYRAAARALRALG